MDPNANLLEQRRLAAAIIEAADTIAATDVGGIASIAHSSVRLAELVQALDEWMSRGGFMPEPWRRFR